jgi:Skp family chaperone for outer membrane proteins
MTFRKITFAAAIAASALIVSTAPAAAQARLSAPVVAVVDTEKVMHDCNACKAAATQLQSQADALDGLASRLATPLQTEGQQLQAAVNAANGKPDAALQGRIEAFQGKQANAQRQVQEQQAVLQRNAQYVQQQVAEKLIPVIEQVSKSSGATMTIGKGGLLYNAATLEITDAVLAALNQQLAAVNTVAPAPQPQQGQPAAQPAAARPAAGKPTTPPPGR